MATISQLEINGTTYDILDANTKTKVDQLEQTVTSLQSSVGKNWSNITPLLNTISENI